MSHRSDCLTIDGSNLGKQVNTKVIICSVGAGRMFDELRQSDAGAYSKFYRHVDQNRVDTTGKLIELISTSRYDIIHLLAEIDSDGRLNGLPGQELLHACAEADVKMLFIASENPPENVTAAFIKGRPESLKGRMNLVETIARRGEVFGDWLKKLLDMMSAGSPLESAWVILHPQAVGPWSEKAPECICEIQRPKVRLLR